MGTERESRAVAAGDFVEVGDQKYTLRPIRVQHLCDLEQEALRYHKREVLNSYAENIRLINDNDRADKLLEAKIDDVSNWDLSCLPQKDVYRISGDCSKPTILRWISDNFGIDLTTNDEKLKDSMNRMAQAILATALDSGALTPEESQKLVGRPPLRARVRYDQWWVTAAVAGMVAFITSSVRSEHPEITEGQIRQWSYAKLVEASRKVEKLSSAALKNG